MPNAIKDFLAPMMMFGCETGWQQLSEMTEEEIVFWQHQITPAARRAHAYWLEQRSDDNDDGNDRTGDFRPSFLAANDVPFVREAEKVGRNEACPCGSGKKYKKCCGLH